MRTVDIKTFEHLGYTGVITHHRLNDEIKEAHPDMGILCDWFCGYVVIPETHPLYKVEYDDTYNSNMDTPEVQDEAYTKNEVIKMIEQLITFEGKEFKKNEKNY